MRDGTAKKILTLTVHWHSCQLPTASCKTNFNGKNCHPNSSIILSLICIHPLYLVNWHLKLERVSSCCQMPVAKQTSMETKLPSSYLLALICIHPIYLSTNIWLEPAWWSAKKKILTLYTVASCQLQSMGVIDFQHGLKLSGGKRYLFRRKSDPSTMQNIEQTNGFVDLISSIHLFIRFHKKNEWFEILIVAG